VVRGPLPGGVVLLGLLAVLVREARAGAALVAPSHPRLDLVTEAGSGHRLPRAIPAGHLPAHLAAHRPALPVGTGATRRSAGRTTGAYYPSARRRSRTRWICSKGQGCTSRLPMRFIRPLPPPSVRVRCRPVGASLQPLPCSSTQRQWRGNRGEPFVPGRLAWQVA